jgi:hypothetical protein
VLQAEDVGGVLDGFADTVDDDAPTGVRLGVMFVDLKARGGAAQESVELGAGGASEG